MPWLSAIVTQQSGRPGLKSGRLARILDSGFDVIHFHNISLVGGPGVLSYGRGLKLYTMNEHWLVCPMHVLWKRNREPCHKPECLRCDNGPEFASLTLRLFLRSEGVKLVFIQPGSPWQNGYEESFIGTFRSECLDIELFRNLLDAQLRIGIWRRNYNELRPHSSIGYTQPREFKRRWISQSLQLEGGVTI